MSFVYVHYVYLNCTLYLLITYYDLQLKPDFKKQTLSVINSELLKAGEALTEISTSPQRCKCLEVFSRSAELISWLKLETGS